MADTPNDNMDHLERALSQDLQKKSLYYYNLITGTGLSFDKVCEQVNFTSKEAVKRLCKIAGEQACFERAVDILKEEKDANERGTDIDMSLKHFIQCAIFDPQCFEKFKQEQLEKEEKRLHEKSFNNSRLSIEQNSIRRLI